MGVYSSTSNMFTVFSVLGFTALGIFMTWAEIPMTPFILSFVLGNMLETNFRNGISYAGGDWTSFFTRPASCILLILAIGSILLPLIRDGMAKFKKG